MNELNERIKRVKQINDIGFNKELRLIQLKQYKQSLIDSDIWNSIVDSDIKLKTLIRIRKRMERNGSIISQKLIDDYL